MATTSGSTGATGASGTSSATGASGASGPAIEKGTLRYYAPPGHLADKVLQVFDGEGWREVPTTSEA